MNTIYLQSYLNINGRNSLIGRKLFDQYKKKSDEILLGHVIVSNEYYDNIEGIKDKKDFISERILYDFSPDVIYIEGGIFASKDMWKIPKNIAEKLLLKGTVIIINDTDINDFNNYKEQYNQVYKFTKSSIMFKNKDSVKPIYGSDKNGSPAKLICKPEKMIISEWLQPIYQDVKEIIVSWPLNLFSFDSLLVSGNQGITGTLSSDVWVDELNCCPFGSVAQIGHGFIVFIAGITTPWSETNKGNLYWLLNIGEFLHKEAKQNISRSSSHYTSNFTLFLSHNSIDKMLVSEVANKIKINGIGIWFDKEKLIPSNSLPKEISKGLVSMTHFILFWSKASQNSNWVERELNSAISQLIESDKPIIIVRLDETPIPTIISDLYRIEAHGLSGNKIGKIISSTIKQLKNKNQ